MTGLFASIVFAFKLGIELFDYVVHGADLQEPRCLEKAKWGIWLHNEGIKLSKHLMLLNMIFFYQSLNIIVYIQGLAND